MVRPAAIDSSVTGKRPGGLGRPGQMFETLKPLCARATGARCRTDFARASPDTKYHQILAKQKKLTTVTSKTKQKIKQLVSPPEEVEPCRSWRA